MQNCTVCKQDSNNVYPLAESNHAERRSGEYLCEKCRKESDQYDFCPRCERLGRDVIFRVEDLVSEENEDGPGYCYDHMPDEDDDSPAGETASQRRQRIQDEQDCAEYLTKDS